METTAARVVRGKDPVRRESGGFKPLMFEPNRKKFYTIPTQAEYGYFNRYYLGACKALE
jgi:hypothetical protein